MFKLSPADQQAIQDVIMNIPLSDPQTAIKGLEDTYKIPFQFPPVITSDSKGMNWKETNAKLYEPMITYDGASARKIQLKWKYIVTGDEWSPTFIKNILMTLRAYFYRSLDAVGSLNLSGSEKSLPLIIIEKLYNIVTQSSTWRSSNVSITPSDRLVYYDSIVTPLSYEVSMDLSLVTKIVFGEKGNGEQEINAEDRPKQDWA